MTTRVYIDPYYGEVKVCPVMRGSIPGFVPSVREDGQTVPHDSFLVYRDSGSAQEALDNHAAQQGWKEVDPRQTNVKARDCQPATRPAVDSGCQPLPALADLARDRYQAGCDQGLPSQPWGNQYRRDFVRDAAEELADACNYLEWELMRDQAAGAEERIRLIIALDYVASAYAKLAAFRPDISGGTSGRDAGRDPQPAEPEPEPGEAERG